MDRSEKIRKQNEQKLERSFFPKVKKETLRHGRWYVLLDSTHERFLNRRELPKATYVWLCANPAFKTLPKGYVIHHLDHNPLNDDLSNLAIMQRHHHLAHHYKDIILRPDIEVDYNCYDVDKSVYFPTCKPRIYQRKDNVGDNWYFLRFRETCLDGSPNKYTTISKFEGKRMLTKEDATRARDSIWPLTERAKQIIEDMSRS